MLYVWAFFTFFSAPLLISPVLGILVKIRYLILDKPNSPWLLLRFVRMSAYAIGVLAVSLLIIRYNTIIHPFTIADNRHYMFYVFRYTILRHPAIRFLLGPVYLSCGWLVYLSLHFPIQPKSQPKLKVINLKQEITTRTLEFSGLEKQIGPTTSLVVILFITMAMTLITTSLVEPRYFIIPWVMWRLNLPYFWPGTLSHEDSVPRTKSKLSNLIRKFYCALQRPQNLLWLETLWFLSINFWTGYIFLYRGYEWPQEPMRVQRFMW